MRDQMLFLALSVALVSGSARADDLVTLSKDPKQWVMAARDYANTRFSPLDQINASNVGKLQAAWIFSVGTQHGQEGDAARHDVAARDALSSAILVWNVGPLEIAGRRV